MTPSAPAGLPAGRPLALQVTTDRLAGLPSSLAEKAQHATLAGDVPALLIHPDWSRPAPFVLWMHGRTAHKEIDPGRFSRWLRAGIAACSIDLPGHGERAEASMQTGERSPEVIARAVAEVDGVLSALAEVHAGLFDTARIGIGGMSMGGMVTLRRLCGPHGFRCAAVEATTGDLEALYEPAAGETPEPAPRAHDSEAVRRADPSQHLGGFEPLPLLALHSEADRMVPWPGQSRFLERLRAHYRQRGADPALVAIATWPETGAPAEHIGFGRVSNEAKTMQTEFFARHLAGAAREASGND